jgi:isopentenyl-diphosphate delta-isomerase
MAAAATCPGEAPVRWTLVEHLLHPSAPRRVAATRRLVEELGIVGASLTPVGTFVYRAVDERSGLVEHEWDHVFVGNADLSSIAPDPLQVEEVALVDPDDIDDLIAGGSTAPWFQTVATFTRQATGAH